MKFAGFLFIAMLAAARATSAQASPGDSLPEPSIQDNSFIVEEAYNQEAGVVQHISGLTLDQRNRAFEYAFTQEWPVGGITHQLSYILPLIRSDQPRSAAKLGDIALNYRYQLIGDGNARVAVAPRLSALLPTGKWKDGAGTGSTGVEVFLPASVVLSDLFVTHLNAGLRFTPSARNAAGDRAGIKKYTAGGSIIGRVLPTLHFLLETIWSRQEAVVGTNKVDAANNWTILPGARAAFNYPSGLQIVPGIGFPIGVGPGRGERGIFIYLSFEHPFNDSGRPAH